MNDVDGIRACDTSSDAASEADAFGDELPQRNFGKRCRKGGPSWRSSGHGVESWHQAGRRHLWSRVRTGSPPCRGGRWDLIRPGWEETVAPWKAAMQDRWDRRRRGWFPAAALWGGLVTVVLAGEVSRAQQPPSAPPPEGAAGEARARPASESLPDSEVPTYYFSPLRFSGRVLEDGQAAELTAEVEVHLTREAGWYDVPLRMGQGVVTGLTYEGPREPIPREPSEGMDDGLHWLFRGQGVHRLRLHLRVPLRRTAAGTNLQLTLPNVPRLFPTQLELVVPAGTQVLEAGRDHQVQVQTTPTGETRLGATIQGSRIDLTWRVVAERPGMLTRAATSLSLQREGDRWRLVAVQDIAADGRVTEVDVRLPSEFRLVSLGGTSYLSHAPIPDRPGWVRVAVRPVLDRSDLQLEWEFEADFPHQGGVVSIDGLEVRDAVRQTGTIAVAAIKGYRVFRQRSVGDAAGEDVKREDVGRVRTSLPAAEVSSAYVFLRQPFELTLNVQETRLVLETRPRVVVTTAADGLTVDIEYHIRVDAGLAKELRLRWPEQTLHDWTVRIDSTQWRVSDATDATSEFPGEARKLELLTPRDGEFTVRLQLHAADPPGPFELTLPVIESDRLLPAWLLLRGRDSVEPELAEEERLPLLADPAADAWLREQSYEPERETAYLWESFQTPLSGRSVMHPLEVKASTVVRITPAAEGRYFLEQEVNGQVHYGRVTEFRFRPPATWATGPVEAALAGVRVRDTNGRLLASSFDNEQLRVAFPNPVQGAVAMKLEYYLPAASVAPDRIEIPIFQLHGSDYQRTQVEFPATGTVAVHVDDAEWTLVSTAAHPVYVTREPRDRLEARWNRDVAVAPQNYHVRQAFARVSLASSGRMHTVVEWDMLSPPPRIVVQAPTDAEGILFHWNGEVIEPVQSPEDRERGRYEIPVAASGGGGSGRLSVHYQRAGPGALRSLSLLELALPVLPAAVDVVETFLEIQLPGDHCLFTYPGGLSPQFRWHPGLVFQRVPTAEYLARRRDILRTADVGELGESSSVYAFHTLGAAPDRHEFRVVGVWMLILLGSGLTLALAFLLWSVPATRNVLTVLVIGFVVAAAGVYAAEAVELLLQPVLLGLAAAAVAISMQSPFQQSREHAWREHPSTLSSPPGTGSGAEASAAGLATTHVRPVELQESGSRR